MSNKNPLKPVAAMFGAAVVVSLTMSPIANAESNPFALNDLSAGYMVADGHEGKCGEGKCGESMKKKAEGKCGEGKCGEGMKKAEGKCGEGKCGEGMKKAEGKCGEGKCADKKAEGKCGEGKCGDKKAEGKCGEGKCGDSVKASKGVDMQGNIVELGNFSYGGDNMAKYADGKIATGVKDPAVCGTFSAAKCSVGHIKE